MHYPIKSYKDILMVTERSNFMKEIKNYEWSSLLDLTGKGLNQFNAVDQNLNCSQLMNNANLDWNVKMKPVLFTKGDNIAKSDKFYSLVKDDREVLVSGLTDSYHPMQNSQIAHIGDYVSRNTGIKFEHAFSYDRDKYVTFLAKTNGERERKRERQRERQSERERGREREIKSVREREREGE